jgi:hypothetical protein
MAMVNLDLRVRPRDDNVVVWQGILFRIERAASAVAGPTDMQQR